MGGCAPDSYPRYKILLRELYCQPSCVQSFLPQTTGSSKRHAVWRCYRWPEVYRRNRIASVDQDEEDEEEEEVKEEIEQQVDDDE